MASTRPARYVIYKGILYRLCGISFDKYLTDYTFHLQEMKDAVRMEEGETIDIHSLLQAPMEKCRELEGRELEVVRIIYESKYTKT